jgi:hypothetical protein
MYRPAVGEPRRLRAQGSLDANAKLSGRLPQTESTMKAVTTLTRPVTECSIS